MKNSPKSLRKDSRDTDYNNLTRAQYYDRKSHTRHLNGESRLLFAVLEDAIRCILLGRWSSLGTEKHRELAETMVWVNMRGDHDLFSFDSICAVFEIEPDGLRRKLNALTSGRQLSPQARPEEYTPINESTDKPHFIRSAANATLDIEAPRPAAQVEELTCCDF